MPERRLRTALDQKAALAAAAGRQPLVARQLDFFAVGSEAADVGAGEWRRASMLDKLPAKVV